MLFSEIPGHTSFKDSLIASVENNHIAHAQLFHSQEGGAGLPMALAFATYLMCEDKQAADACGKCANCHKMQRFIHPDVHFFFPKPSAKAGDYEKSMAESQKSWRAFLGQSPYGDLSGWISFSGFENKNVLISKEDSRQVIRTVSMKSFEGSFKILIIWCPEMMHPAAANAILKVLEEPPTQTIYLLVSHAYEGLMATITSRTQFFAVPPFQEEEIKQFLIREKQIDQQTAEKVSRLAGGSLGRALKELESAGDVAYQKFQEWMRKCLVSDYTSLIRLSDSFGTGNRSQQRNDLIFALTLIRESIVGQTEESLVSREGEEGTFIRNFSKAVSLEVLEKLYFLLSESLTYLERNANPRITFMNLSIQFCDLLKKRKPA